jgi:EAL domain-containing protein (putative c-di-GMP-specific phosphodiesterase class I)
VLGLAFGALLAGAVVRRRDPITEIDEALAVNEFKPFMQPIVSLTSGDIVGCEVLARWVRPDGTVDPPQRFIRQAEDSGRIVPLTHQLVSETLEQLRSWMNHKPDFKVAFNISPGHLMADGFVEDFARLVDAAEVSRSQVVIEVTERQELDDLTAAGERIAELRKLGFKVAIDDAGTGHSGLSYLQRLGVNIVKIDKLFVDSIELDYSARVIVGMLVKVAGELGMTTVAEGVERAEQVAALKACGVDEIQGFYVSPAVPSFDFLRMLYSTGRSPATRDGESLVRIA